MMQTPSTPAKQTKEQPPRRGLFPRGKPLVLLALLGAMEAALLLLDAVLPLRGLYFYAAFPTTKLESSLLLPTRLLFANQPTVWPIHYLQAVPATPEVARQETALLFVSLSVLYGLYLLCVRLGSHAVTLRFLLGSTSLLGLTCVLFPAATSQDVFSYIAYARMGVLYHLNPLTTLPTAIHTDPVYPYLFWIHQPSAYGPTWALITSGLQGLLSTVGFSQLLSMVLLLRLWGLFMHLATVCLLWRLSGALQNDTGPLALARRGTATLAFAWNPLLLVEACVNAHNDTTILLLVLWALSCLLSRPKAHPAWQLVATVLLTMAACVKVTLFLLMPGLLLYLWRQPAHRLHRVVGAAAACIGTTIVLYAPFWQQGAVLQVFSVNPGLTRDINSPWEFLIHLVASLRGHAVTFLTPDTGTPTEITTHHVAFVLFLLCAGVLSLCWLRELPTLSASSARFSLVRWLALIWLLYCLVGSPWLWPWYLTTFFGLFALLEATAADVPLLGRVLHLPLAVRLLAFALLGIYGFATWGPHVSLVPRLPYFQWTYVRGLWLCLVPLLALRWSAVGRLGHHMSKRWLQAGRGR